MFTVNHFSNTYIFVPLLLNIRNGHLLVSVLLVFVVILYLLSALKVIWRNWQ